MTDRAKELSDTLTKEGKLERTLINGLTMPCCADIFLESALRLLVGDEQYAILKHKKGW